MLKKMMLLAMAVGALLAFSVPAASASTWDTNGEPIGESTEEGDQINFTGTLSSTKGPVKITCEASASTTLWNSGGAVGEATLTLSGLPGTGGCTVAVNFGAGHVDLAKCHVNPSSGGANWPISTNVTTLSIAEANFTNEFVGEQCATVLGIPSGTKVSDSGTASGTVVGECIVFNNTGGFIGGSTIDGSLCPPVGSGLELTH